MVRKFEVGRALESFSVLNEQLNDLTLQEVLAALDLESSTRRRRSFIDRLISRAVRLNEIEFQRQLKEKYHGTHPQDPDRR